MRPETEGSAGTKNHKQFIPWLRFYCFLSFKGCKIDSTNFVKTKGRVLVLLFLFLFMFLSSLFLFFALELIGRCHPKQLRVFCSNAAGAKSGDGSMQSPETKNGTSNNYNIIETKNKTIACNWQKRKLYIK